METLQIIFEWLQANYPTAALILSTTVTIICRKIPRKADRDRNKKIKELKEQVKKEIEK